MSSLIVMQEKIKAMIDKEIETSFGLEVERRKDPLGDSIYLFFLTRNKITSPAIDNLIDWMNSWVEDILNKRRFSRFVDREITSALIGYYTLKSINRLKTQLDIVKLATLLSEYVANDSFFKNFTYSTLALLSLVEERSNVPEYTKVFDWVKRNIHKEVFFNDAKNLVFASLLLNAMNVQDELKKLVNACLERVSKNAVRFDDMVYYAWILWNYKENVEEKNLSKIIDFTKNSLENVTRIFDKVVADESVIEMYGYDERPEEFSKILLGTTLDLLVSFNASKIMLGMPNRVYVEEKLISMGWKEAWRELDRALDAFEKGRMPDCCNNLRMGLITVWIKVCEKFEGKPIPLPSGQTPDIPVLKKCLREHGFSGDSIGMISQTWAYVSERAHIEKKGGKAPEEPEVRYGIQLTFVTIEHLLRSLPE